MINSEIEINDISNELLIVNKHTIETLFEIEDGGNSFILYMFYYKTAKWQKTNCIKANDTYVRQCLKWGKTKITNTKKILKEKGLIDIIQRRNEKGELMGWYIQLHYLVSQGSIHNHCQQEVDFTTSCYEDTNALRKQINALREQVNALRKQYIFNKEKYIKENEELKKQIEELKSKPKSKGKKSKPKKIKHEYGEYKNVLLADDELEKIKNEYPNYEELITYLDEYIEMKGYKAKSHYLCIKKWVVEAVESKKIKTTFKTTKQGLPNYDYDEEDSL